MNVDIELDGVASLEEDLEDLKDKWTSDRAYKVGTNVQYAITLEMGRGPIEAPEGSAIPIETESGTIFRKRVSGHPPYPWFKPAIREFKANPETFIIDTTDWNSIQEIPSADVLVLSIATGLEDRMKDNVNAQDSTADRSPGTHPDHPSRDSGNLTAEISAQRIS